MRTATYPGPQDGFLTPGKTKKVITTPVGTRPRLTWRRVISITLFTILAMVSSVMLAAGVWTLHALGGLDDDLNALLNYKPGQATLIYASDGSLLARVAKENRIYVKLDRIPLALRNATVAAEDRRFWSHPGVDFKGLGRAFVKDLRTGSPAEGGSTLTMQLVKNIQLSPEKTLERKVREAALALRLEQVYSKPELLEMYLNQVYYGNGAYGVGAAARAFFGRAVEKLTPAQCALLATLPRRPTGFNPRQDPKGSMSRRNRLLASMAAQGYLNARRLQNAQAEPLGVQPPSATYKNAPYFVDAVVNQLTDLYGHEAVYQGGLRVFTTVNPAMQRVAEAALKEGVENLKGRHVSQGALVSLDPFTGEVKALVGGADYRKSAYNRALHAHRQPGSSFKPFVYAAAMNSNGLSPLDRITDAPLHLKVQDVAWQPKNHDNKYAGQTTLANAFAQSMNTPAVRLGLAAGLDQVALTAKSCGIRSKLREVPSLALGTSEVTPLELTAAYSVFATQGEWREPKLIRKIESVDGKIYANFNTALPQNVMDPLTARKVDYLLRAVVENGTGRSVLSIPHARGKTGTTQEDKDAWFVGYTPELVTGVWVGNDTPSRMQGVWGGNGCAPIWKQFMGKAVGMAPARAELPAYVPPKAKPKSLPSDSENPLGSISGDNSKDAPEWSASNENVNTVETSEASTQARHAEVTPETSTGGTLRRVRICLESGLPATADCPETVMKEIDVADIGERCPLHGPNGTLSQAAKDDDSNSSPSIRLIATHPE